MIDLAEIWGWLRNERGHAEGAALTLPDVIKKNPELFEDFVMPARIQIRQDEFHGPMFELHPRPDIASPKSWVWVIAVRSGALGDMVRLRENARTPQSWWQSKNLRHRVEALDGALAAVEVIMAGQKNYNEFTETEARLVLASLCEDKGAVEDAREALVREIMQKLAPEPDMAAYALETGSERGEAMSRATQLLEKWHEDIGDAASFEAIYGRQIIDLVAISANFTKVLGRYHGCATVLGYPQRPEEEERAVRLFRDLKSFVAASCRGALLIGAAEENYHWLSRCDGGIITDDVAHGKAIKKILTRPYTGPQVLVAG